MAIIVPLLCIKHFKNFDYFKNMNFDFVPGNGKFIFFLHGWGGDKNSFAILKNHIAQINRNMVFVSFPGFGNSEEPEFAFSLDDYVSRLVDLIVKMAKGKSVDIVCHSFGGRVAILLASKYPFLVNKIMMVDGAGLKPKRGLKYYFKVLKYKILKKKVADGKVDKSVLKKYGSSDYKKLSPVMKQTFINVVNRDLKNEAKQINMQILLFWGEKDTETPLFMAKKYNKFLKNSTLIVSKNSGHFSYLDDFDLFYKCFLDFILNWREFKNSYN